VWIRVGPWKALVVTGEEASRHLLLDDRTFDKGGPLYDRIRETGGNGLVSCPHSDHRRQRRLVQPSFHPDRMPGYAEVMARQVHCRHRPSYGAEATGQFGGVELCVSCRNEWRTYLTTFPVRAAEVLRLPELHGTVSPA
jgi:hypothetical protein